MIPYRNLKNIVGYSTNFGQDITTSNVDIMQGDENDYKDIVEKQNDIRWASLSENAQQAYALLGAQLAEMRSSQGMDFNLLEETIQGMRNITSTMQETFSTTPYPKTLI
ncbi:hypothetical protein [Parasitella parasitica]|uniref:Uncharacterized protein n=1 Tax=Parasitella parasitica TaxID=35722 RepID=A0A0B7NNG0_9FUNG|nr:hypothetical protein [Parasitella parasitica]